MIKIGFRLDASRWITAFVWAVVICAAMLFAQPAFAQSVQVTNSTDSATGGLNESAASCAAPLTRTFSVGSNFTITDVNIGVLAAHTYRGDLIMDLQAPGGTTVRLTNGSGSIGADNFNVLFDDSAASNITTHTGADTATAGTLVPPYEETFRSENALSAFNGLSSAGTWTLSICDQFGGDSGTFYQADLFLTGPSVQQADLSLTQSINTTSPLPGAEVTYTLTVTNSAASDATASSIEVRDLLPAGLIFRSQSGSGTYNSGTGVWTVGSLAVGASATIQLNATNNTTPGTSITNVAEIISSSLPDPDSGTNNGVTSEDDYASRTFTTASYPSAGSIPTLSCAAGSNLFDWDAQAWTAGQLSRSFTVGGIATNLQFSGATNRLVNDPSTASATPARNTSSTGGATGQNSLILAVDFANTSESVVGTWTFTGGVSGLQFTIADVDHFFGQFSDRITVTGSYQGNSVTPTLTRGNTNTVNGNTASAIANADNTTNLGNVVVTFGQNVDTVVVEYGSAAGNAPANPGIQAIAFMDMTLCNPADIADLSLVKTLLTASPGRGDTATYRLSLTNAAGSPQTATSVEVQDYLPAGFDFVSATSPDFNGTTGLWSVSSLAPGQTVTVDVSGTVTASAGATITNIAEITASGISDPDSSPNNGVTTEDDYDEVSFTVSGARVAGTPPVLSCPAGSVIFDWNAVSWTAGTTNNTYALGTIGNINFSIVNPGTWYNSATYGGQSPARQNVIHGGFGTGEFSLSEIVDMNTVSDETVTTITLPTAMNGAQFTIFDVDFNASQFADRVEVIGYNGASTVMPTLTNGIANYVIGNEAFGDALSADAEPNGNVVVTFSSPIDRIEIRYGNYSAAPANPGLQGVALHDFTFCNPITELGVTKVSTVLSDPVNGTTNQKAIPGALVEYTFGISNSNDIAVQNVVVTDFFPADLRMCLNDIGGDGPVGETGIASAGLTYSYLGLNSATDDIEFTTTDPSSGSPIDWSHTPVLDADGCDASITGFRLFPSGDFDPATSFTLRARFRIM